MHAPESERPSSTMRTDGTGRASAIESTTWFRVTRPPRSANLMTVLRRQDCKRARGATFYRKTDLRLVPRLCRQSLGTRRTRPGAGMPPSDAEWEALVPHLRAGDRNALARFFAGQ